MVKEKNIKLERGGGIYNSPGTNTGKVVQHVNSPEIQHTNSPVVQHVRAHPHLCFH
jgi:hypothetical protein